MKVKQNNKNKLAAYLKEVTGVDVNPCSLFDIQVDKGPKKSLFLTLSTAR